MSHSHKHPRNKHHLKPKIRGGEKQSSNMLLIDIDKHIFLHKIFGNHTLYEIIHILIRVARAKHYEEIEPKIKDFYKLIPSK